MKRCTAVLLALLMILSVCLGVNSCVYAENTSDAEQSTAAVENDSEDTINSVDDLPGKTIGVQLGTTGDIYVSDYEGDEAGTIIERYNKGADAIQSLLQNKVDCVLIDEQPAIQYVKKNPTLKILDEPFTEEEYAIAISKDNTELKNQINGCLEEMKEDGTLQSIIDNYIGSEAGNSPYESPENVDRSNGTLTMATNAAFPPYEYRENNEVVGIDADIAQAICDKLGMELVINDIEFDAIILAVQTGKADVGISGMTVTEDRLKNIDFSESYITTKQVIIVNDSSVSGSSQSLMDKFKQSFVDNNNWQYLLTGLKNTLIIALFAVIIGFLLGFLIAVVRSTADKTKTKNPILRFLNLLCRIYLTVIRGTPVLVQLMIIYYVIFASVDINKIVAGSIAFGLNSAAYVAEIFRSGIMSVDNGQFEAGRSLGFNYSQTMIYIIMPQAFKNVLPTLANEFIVLLKETSVSGYIGTMDLTKGGDIIRSNTYQALLPLLAVAAIYLVLVMGLSHLVGKLERRLRNNER